MASPFFKKLKELFTSSHPSQPITDNKEITFDYFVRNYWDLLISHVSEFHTLTHDFIVQYGDELDWNSLSKNTSLNWTIEFIRENETRFRWVELAMNKSIAWQIEWIEEFRERLDWHYLRQHRALPVSDAFIQKYRKHFKLNTDNPYLTDELRERYKELLITHSPNYVAPGMEAAHLADLKKALSEYKYYSNQPILYDAFIAVHLRDYDLSSLFEQHYDYTQRYYYLNPVHHDRQGLTPEYLVKGEHPFYDREFNPDNDNFDVKEVVTFVNGSLQEGRARLYEVLRLVAGNFSYPVLLISENVKAYLETLKLPPHRFHPVNLQATKISTSTNFYLFHVSKDVLTKDIDYQRAVFRLSKRIGRGPRPIPDDYELIKDRINNASELLDYRRKQARRNENDLRIDIDVHADQYLVKSDYDLYTYSVHRYFIVPEAVKKTLETLFPGQMEFTSAQALHIRMDHGSYVAKGSVPTPTHLHLKPLDVFTDAEEDYLFAKMNRLQLTPAVLPPLNTDKDEFTDIEKQLNARFPEAFKKYYRKGHGEENYTMLPISGFYISNEYAERLPESYRAVLIAENGIGDSLGLLLQRDSDYDLRPELYEFLHESGEIEKLKEWK